ncbi:TolC family protein [Prosthecochloris sp. ZM_2]|nr:TolC family protein [Prosthecochloris sp. ZM_2]
MIVMMCDILRRLQGAALAGILILPWVMVATPAKLVASDAVLTLDEAFAMALERNPDINVARGEARIAHNNVHIGNAGLLPRVDLVGSVTYQDNEAAAVEESTTTGIQLQASYTFFDGFGTVYTFQKLRSSGRLGELKARNTIENTMVSVSESYYRLAEAEQQLSLSREALSISRERQRRAQLRSDYGQANTLDVLSATVDANSDSVAVLEARLERDNARRSLNSLLNRPVDTPCSVDATVRFDDGLALAAVQEGAKQSYADYLLAAEEMRQADLDLAIATSDFFPSFGVQLNYGFSETDPGFMVDLDDPAEGFSAVLNMTLPLFNGFKTSIARQNAKILQHNSRLEYDKAGMDLEKLVADTWEAYQNSLTVLAFQEKNLESAELNFSRTRELSVLGQVTSTAFREAQLNLLSARQQIASARFDARLFEIRLKRIAGMLLRKAE